MEPYIPLYVIIPLATAFLIPVLGRFFKGFSRYITSVVFLFLTVLSFTFIFNGNHDTIVYSVGGWKPVNNIPIAIYLVMDGFSGFMLVVINLIALLAAFYSISYIRRYTAGNNYYALLCLMVAGMNGVVLTGDLFNLYVFLEIASIASYALVAFGVEKEELEASFKYQVLGGLASLFILMGIGLLYWATGTLNMADISVILHNLTGNKVIIFIQLLFIAGFGMKTAMVPFHAWLPDAHSSAPSPISSMLSGILIKAIGLYVIVRMFFNMFVISHQMAVLITTIGTLSMVVGVFLAIGQWDLKRLLAYHSISQMGYIVLGIGMGMLITASGGDKILAAFATMGGLYHLINHAVFKGLLFLNAGAIEYSIGTRNLKNMGGLFRKMPVTSATSLSASMAISGIPPFNGFFSKLIIILAAVKAGYYLLAILAVIVSIITLASFMKVQRYAFFNKPDTTENIKSIPFTMKFSMVALAVLCILLSILIVPGIRELVLMPAVNSLLGGSAYSSIISAL